MTLPATKVQLWDHFTIYTFAIWPEFHQEVDLEKKAITHLYFLLKPLKWWQGHNFRPNIKTFFLQSPRNRPLHIVAIRWLTQNKPAAQAAGADPSRCNCTNRPNLPRQ